MYLYYTFSWNLSLSYVGSCSSPCPWGIESSYWFFKFSLIRSYKLFIPKKLKFIEAFVLLLSFTNSLVRYYTNDFHNHLLYFSGGLTYPTISIVPCFSTQILKKSIFRGGCLNKTAHKNLPIFEAVDIKRPLLKN